ncbi:MAG: acyl-CoA dehydrogenase, partial [Deltaproteobacteria bacterium]
MEGLTETQRLFAEAVRSWCESELEPRVAALEAGEELPYPLLERLGSQLGISALLGETVRSRLRRLQEGAPEDDPTTHGAALGGDPLLPSLLLCELSRCSPGFALTLISTLGCAMAILARGRAALIESLVLPIVSFKKIGAWALTEPEAGSDAFGGMKTTAVVEGDRVVLNGQKTFITNAPYADVFTVYARVRCGGDERIGAVVVERGSRGLETGPPMKKMGMHDSPTGEVFLSDCVVPASNLLDAGRSGGRGGEAVGVLNLERAAMPAMCLGIIERCVEESVRYAKTRRQFGRPIGEFQGVGFKLARMAVARENARNLVRALAEAQAAGTLRPELASIAKLYCAEQATKVALDAIQIHGGSGYMAELPL